MEKYAATKKTHDHVDTASKLVMTAGAPIALAATTRALYQSNVNPNAVAITGGTSNKYVKNPAYATVFDTQVNAYAKEFKNAGHEVETFSGYNTHAGPGVVTTEGKTLKLPLPFKTRTSPPVEGVPILNIDVGSHIGAEGRSVLSRAMLGRVNYRAFSDFGPGNQNQRRLDPAVGYQKNMMYAPHGKQYNRFIVPGGDLVPGTVPATKDNINVTSIPVTLTDVDEKKQPGTLYRPNNKKKPLVSVTYGSGYGWSDPKFPNKEQNFSSITQALDEEYGKGNYRLAILGGKNTSPDFKDYFAKITKDNPDYYFGKKTGQKGVLNLLSKSDVTIMMPGSTSAELAAKPGYKPRIVALDPGMSLGGHFKYNTEWLNRSGHPAEILYAGEKGLTKDDVKRAIAKSKISPQPTTESVKFGKPDVEKIMTKAREDFKHSVMFTKKMRNAGFATLAAGAGLYGTNKLYDYLEKKSAREKRDASDVILPAGITGGTIALTKGTASHIKDNSDAKLDYKNFDEVLKDYSGVKKGDVVFFQGSFMQGKVHPIVITKANGPESEYVEFAPRSYSDGPTNIKRGVLKDKLKKMTHTNLNGPDDVYYSEFSRRLGGIYRGEKFNEAAFDKAMDVVKNNEEHYKYSPLELNFDLCKGKGTCVNFADRLMRESGAKPQGETAFLPHRIPEGMTEVVAPRHVWKSKINSTSLGVTGLGAGTLYKGVRDDNTTEKVVGTGLMAGGAAIQISDKANLATNAATGFASDALGNMVVTTPATVADKISGHKGWAGSYSQSVSEWANRHPRVTKGVGGVMLGAPALYLATKGLSKLDKKDK